MADRASCEEQIMKSAAPIIAGSAAIGGIAGGVLAVKLAAPVVVPMTAASIVVSAAAGGLVGGSLSGALAVAATEDMKDQKVANGATALAGISGAVGGAALVASPIGAVAAVGAVAGGSALGGGAYLAAKGIAKLSCLGEKASHADASEVLPPLATPVAVAPAKGPVRS